MKVIIHLFIFTQAQQPPVIVLVKMDMREFRAYSMRVQRSWIIKSVLKVNKEMLVLERDMSLIHHQTGTIIIQTGI